MNSELLLNAILIPVGFIGGVFGALTFIIGSNFWWDKDAKRPHVPQSFSQLFFLIWGLAFSSAVTLGASQHFDQKLFTLTYMVGFIYFIKKIILDK